MLFRVRAGDFVDKPSFEEALRVLAARRPRGEDHPTLQELVAYRAGELSAEGDDRIQEHLTQCRECAQLLLDLAEFEQFPPPPEEMGPVDARAETAWQRLRSRLREEEEPEEEAPVLQHRSRPRVALWRRPAIPWALAAGLALCVMGLGLRVGSLASRLAELSKPQAVRVVTLESEEDTRRSGGDEPAPVHAGEGVFYDLLLSADPEAPTYPLYQVEIVSASGRAEPVLAGRQPADEGTLRVVLLSAPEAGDYLFEVSGIEGEQETPVGRYPFTILPPGAAPG
jgi:hypothetical protein